MPTRQTTMRLTPATDRQLNELQSNGFGTVANIIAIAVDRMHREEIGPVTNAQIQDMARTALKHWDFDSETDPDGAIKAGLEYIASDGEFDQEIITANVRSREDWDALQDWALRLGQDIVNA